MRPAHYNIRALWQQQQGIVLVEMLLIAPVLVFIFAIALHIASIYYLTNAMEKTVRIASRQLSALYWDDETAGALTSCATLNGTTITGLDSAELYACQKVSHLSSEFLVRAYDGNSQGSAVAGATVYVELQLPRSAALTLLPSLAGLGPEQYAARVTMRAEMGMQ